MKMDSQSNHIHPSSGAGVGHKEAEDEVLELAVGEGLVVADEDVTAAAVNIQKHQERDINMQAAVVEEEMRRSRISSLSDRLSISSVTTITFGTRLSVKRCSASLKKRTSPQLRRCISCGATIAFVSASASML